jgi:hypothetical protein
MVIQDSGLTNEDSLLARQLLGKVREKFENEFIGGSSHGSFLEVGVLRCDGTAPKDTFKERHCTFISFPYLSNQQPLPAPRKDIIRPHPTQGLLQTLYHFESTKSREYQQVINKMPTKDAQKFVHVPQVWSIVFDSGRYALYSNS